MSLYAIGDLHLHFQSELKAPGQINGRIWQNHEEAFRRNCEKLIRPEDTLVLVGDHSWGRNLEESREDLEYIAALPGRKILLRGNHDMFWDAKKTEALNQRYEGRLHFLQNNYYAYGEYALVGTKGYAFEGPFYVNSRGQIVGWDQDAEEQADRLVEREKARLRVSLEAARKDGYKKFILFLHYPPTSVIQEGSPFTDLAQVYHAEQVIYAHCHGEHRFHDSLMGLCGGIRYSLVSGDYLHWMPMRVLE